MEVVSKILSTCGGNTDQVWMINQPVKIALISGTSKMKERQGKRGMGAGGR